MFKVLMLSLALHLCSAPFPLRGDFPKGLPEPVHTVEDGSSGLRYWIVMDPKCVIESLYTDSGDYATEVTMLDPDNTLSADVVNFIYRLEGIQEEDSPMTFSGTDEDSCIMYTQTGSGHVLLWERNPKTGKILKVTILYQREEPLQS